MGNALFDVPGRGGNAEITDDERHGLCTLMLQYSMFSLFSRYRVGKSVDRSDVRKDYEEDKIIKHSLLTESNMGNM